MYPTVEMVPIPTEPKLNHTLGAMKLRRLLESSAGVYATARPGDGFRGTQGLTQAAFVLDLSTNPKVHGLTESRAGPYCVTVDKITARLGFADTVVYVDRRYAKNSCNYNAIMQHEQGHVEINQQVMLRYIPVIMDRLKRAAGQLKPIYVKDAAGLRKVEQTILNSVNEAADPVLKAMQDEQVAAHTHHDRPESYDYTTGQCKRW